MVGIMNSAYTCCDALSVTPLAFAGSSANANNRYCYSISAFIKTGTSSSYICILGVMIIPAGLKES